MNKYDFPPDAQPHKVKAEPGQSGELRESVEIRKKPKKQKDIIPAGYFDIRRFKCWMMGNGNSTL